MAYVWHAVSEEEKQEIRENAKKLLDEFSSKLDKIKVVEPKADKKENLRTEGTGQQTNEDFREIIFDNAPKIEDGLIIAETGAWKK
jgi:Asp-tRNA(Asn)/Glu-tRNA(Gln) amidotransferase C subunit